MASAPTIALRDPHAIRLYTLPAMTAFTRRRFLEAAGVAAAMPAFDAVAGQTPTPPGAITVEKDVVFGKVAACVAYYPVVDGPPSSAATATYMTPDVSPTVLFHGVADTTVPIESSRTVGS